MSKVVRWWLQNATRFWGAIGVAVLIVAVAVSAVVLAQRGGDEAARPAAEPSAPPVALVVPGMQPGDPEPIALTAATSHVAQIDPAATATEVIGAVVDRGLTVVEVDTTLGPVAVTLAPSGASWIVVSTATK